MSSPDGKHLVFAYGSLKTGEPNHSLITKAAPGSVVFHGKARSTVKYPVIVTTKYNIPYGLAIDGLGYEVEGELYEVNDEIFALMDELEIHPHLYKRTLMDIKVYTDNQGVTLEIPQVKACWVYRLVNFKKELLNETFFASYHDKSEHHGRYVPRSQLPDGVHEKDMVQDHSA